MLPEHTRSVRLICRIDVTAFAAVMIVVLWVLIVKLMYFTPKPRSVSLPAMSSAVSKHNVLREDAIEVYVLMDGIVWFRNQKFYRLNGELARELRNALVEGSENRAYIYADARSKYGLVSEVLDEVRAAGIEDVTFLARSHQQELP